MLEENKTKLGYIAGILIGILFSIPWLLCYALFYRYSVYLSVLIVIGVILGYKLVCKNIYNDRKTRIYLVVSSILIVILNIFIFAPLLAKFGVLNSELRFLYENHLYLIALIGDLSLALIIILIPSLFLPMDFKNEDDKRNYDYFIDDVEEIFEKYDAFSKDSAVDKQVIKKELKEINISNIRRVLYIDFIKNNIIKSSNGKWYFNKNKKTKVRFGLYFTIFFLMIFITFWNIFTISVKEYKLAYEKDDMAVEKAKNINYKVNSNLNIMMPDCMKLMKKNKDTNSYYYQYVSQNVYKSPIEVIEISYYINLPITDRYDKFKDSIEKKLKSYNIVSKEDKNINDNKILYYKLYNLVDKYVTNSYFVPIEDHLLEIYIHINKDNYDTAYDDVCNDIIKSISVNE